MLKAMAKASRSTARIVRPPAGATGLVTVLTHLLFSWLSAHAAPPLPGAAPNQPPPAVSAFADLDLRWSGGVLTLEHLTLGRFPTPTPLRHYVGRFEAEVSGHGAVLETLRFDLPLLGEVDSGIEEKLAETMRTKMTTVGVVRVPLPEGAESIRIRDRRAKTGSPPALEIPLSGSRASGPAARTVEAPQAPQAAQPQPAKETAERPKAQVLRREGAALPPSPRK